MSIVSEIKYFAQDVSFLFAALKTAQIEAKQVSQYRKGYRAAQALADAGFYPGALNLKLALMKTRGLSRSYERGFKTCRNDLINSIGGA